MRRLSGCRLYVSRLSAPSGTDVAAPEARLPQLQADDQRREQQERGGIGIGRALVGGEEALIGVADGVPPLGLVQPGVQAVVHRAQRAVKHWQQDDGQELEARTRSDRATITVVYETTPAPAEMPAGRDRSWRAAVSAALAVAGRGGGRAQLSSRRRPRRPVTKSSSAPMGQSQPQNIRETANSSASAASAQRPLRNALATEQQVQVRQRIELEQQVGPPRCLAAGRRGTGSNRPGPAPPRTAPRCAAFSS